jgi:hypothetical protein
MYISMARFVVSTYNLSKISRSLRAASSSLCVICPTEGLVGEVGEEGAVLVAADAGRDIEKGGECGKCETPIPILSSYGKASVHKSQSTPYVKRT